MTAPTSTEWMRLCKRTADPKLAYIEHVLTHLGIQHRRNGESFHAPILEVHLEDHERAWAVLIEPDEDYGIFDEIPDEDPFFQEARNGAPYTPHDWTGDLCSNCGQKLQTNHPPLLTCYPCAIEGLAVVGPGDAAVDERTVETVAQFEARRG